MTRFLPKTLFGQILLALCTGLIAAQAAGLWLVFDDRIRYGDGLLGAFAAPRIAGVASFLDKTTPNERTRLLHALSVPPTRFSIGDKWAKPDPNLGDEAREFVERFQQELGSPMQVQILSIKPYEAVKRDDGTSKTAPVRPEGNTGNSASDTSTNSAQNAPKVPGAIDPENLKRVRPGPRIAFVTGQVMLSDGTILNFRHSVPQQQSDFPLRLLGLLSILAASVASLAAWAVRRLTRPLEALAEAATGLSKNLDQPVLDESGPQEVARAAQAFNAMQTHLKGMIETRAQALAGVSHDLRLPITRLRLRLEKIPSDELRSKMEEDLSEMDTMINNTLEFLRAGNNVEKKTMLDLNALLESIAEDMEPLGAHIQIKGSAKEAIFSRPQALKRCLSNLLDNARRYGSGAIEVEVHDSPDQVWIEIKDRGPGIPESDLERVFEPYVRMETSRAKHTGGSGLGLTIARAIARGDGGDVILHARHGGGTIARLKLQRQQLG